MMSSASAKRGLDGVNGVNGQLVEAKRQRTDELSTQVTPDVRLIAPPPPPPAVPRPSTPACPLHASCIFWEMLTTPCPQGAGHQADVTIASSNHAAHGSCGRGVHNEVQPEWRCGCFWLI